MARSRFIWDPMVNDLVPAAEYYARRPANHAPMIAPDLLPYQNMIDFKVVDGRKAHREFLARNDAHVVEYTPQWIKDDNYATKHGYPPGRHTAERGGA